VLTDPNSRPQIRYEIRHCCPGGRKLWKILGVSRFGVKNNNKLNDQRIQGMDQAKFEKSMKEPDLQAKANQDLLEGIRAGVQGTPAVLIDGKFIRNRSLEGLKAVTSRNFYNLLEI
jgi:hypothetical protein